MFVFVKENMKYPAVCTEDRKHWILVNCTPEMVNDFAKEMHMPVGQENYYVVHKSTNPRLFSMACASLPRRLNPILGENQHPYENYYSMHKFFYINKRQELIVKGVYVGDTSETCPFEIANTDPETGFKCLKDIKING